MCGEKKNLEKLLDINKFIQEFKQMDNEQKAKVRNNLNALLRDFEEINSIDFETEEMNKVFGKVTELLNLLCFSVNMIHLSSLREQEKDKNKRE